MKISELLRKAIARAVANATQTPATVGVKIDPRSDLTLNDLGYFDESGEFPKEIQVRARIKIISNGEIDPKS